MRRAVWIALAALLISGGVAAAQNFPSRPLTVIVPFSAGGPSDAMARILAERMKVTLGEQVLVENVTGAGGSIGVGRAVRFERGVVGRTVRRGGSRIAVHRDGRVDRDCLWVGDRVCLRH